jgi:succinate-semialdehyde dehydrogenase/glutarate-semialdehyde dehydrogenase
MADALRMLIGGEWVDAEGGATFEAIAPSTGEVIATLPEGTRADAVRAIAAASTAASSRAMAIVIDLS